MSDYHLGPALKKNPYIYKIKNQSIDPINLCAVQARLTFWSTLTRTQRCPPAGESRGHTLSPTLRKCGCAPSPQPFTKWTPWWLSRKQTEIDWQWPTCAGPWPFAYGSPQGANLMCVVLVWWAEHAWGAVCTHCFCPFWWTQAELFTGTVSGWQLPDSRPSLIIYQQKWQIRCWWKRTLLSWLKVLLMCIIYHLPADLQSRLCVLLVLSRPAVR